MRCVFLGPPGSGKGTQCKRIVEKYGVQHLSCGDILRKERVDGTELGKQAQSFMDSGALVPDDVIIGMMITAIKNAGGNGFILDGFPRTVVQAVELDKALEEAGEKIDVLLNLKIDDEIIEARMTGRRSCPKCGAVYHIENLKPKVDGICDDDGAQLIQRPDDNPEVVSNRLKTYHEQTEPVIDYYKENNTVIDVDAEADVDVVTEGIFEKLDSKARA